MREGKGRGGEKREEETKEGIGEQSAYEVVRLFNARRVSVRVRLAHEGVVQQLRPVQTSLRVLLQQALEK